MSTLGSACGCDERNAYAAHRYLTHRNVAALESQLDSIAAHCLEHGDIRRCSDCGEDELYVPTDCCDGNKASCRTVDLLDRDGSVDVVQCRQGHGCNT